MELDAETLEELSCKSSWDMWEFAVALHTSTIERREATRERVAEHRKWNRVRKRAAERAFHEKHRDARNAAKRDRAQALKAAAIARGEPTPEQLKWQRRKEREKARIGGTVPIAKPVSATVAPVGGP